MQVWYAIVTLFSSCLLGCTASHGEPDPSKPGPKPDQMWRAIYLAPEASGIAPKDFVRGFRQLVEDALAPAAINAIVFSMRSRFCYACRPEFANIELKESATPGSGIHFSLSVDHRQRRLRRATSHHVRSADSE